jgi:tRNA-specific 2-thiouridylase
MASNTLYVVQGHDHPWLLSRTLVAGNTSWVAGAAPEPGASGGAKTRYRQADAPCVFASSSSDASGDGRFELRFDDEQWAVTPGQSAVLYQGDVCLGGGIIESAATVQGFTQAARAAQAAPAALLVAK